MLIAGLQKVTLLDFPGKLACTVFAPGCNFRCPFCHNASLVTEKSELIPESEFFEFLESRKGRLQGVCVTGGEPTLQRDFKDFLAKIKSMGFLVKLDTNGYAPEKLKEAVNGGLADYVAMDIKNSLQKYGETVGIADFNTEPIKESVKFLLSGAVDYEFRTTVVRELHTAQDIEEITALIDGAKRYFLQGFVDSGDLIGEGLSGYDKKEMENLLKVAKMRLSVTELRGM